MKDRCPTKPVYYVISGGVARTRLWSGAVAAADDTASSAGILAAFVHGELCSAVRSLNSTVYWTPGIVVCAMSH